MSLIVLNKIWHFYTGKPILSDVNLTLTKSDKIGLVGVNGSGKTTLLRIIAGDIEPYKGRVQKAKGTKIAFLKQNTIINNNLALYEYIRQSHKEILDIKTDLEKLNEILKTEATETNIKKLQTLQHIFETAGGYEIETKIKTVLTSLNFPRDTWDKPVNDFSGGEKTRIQLAKILTQDFDYLLLDEPTNYLDIEMIIWLQRYLKNLSKPYLIVSHDRYFLNNMITSVILLENGKLLHFKGNYDKFEKEYEERKARQEKEAEKQQEFIKKTEEFIAKNIAGQKTKQAKSRMKQLEKITKVQTPTKARNIKLNIKSVDRSGNDVFVLENVSFGYNNKIILKDVSLTINYKDKAVILGKNGSGKTTFLKLLNKEIYPQTGKIKQGSSLQIAYFDQMHINLDNDISVFDTIKNLCPSKTNGYVLSYLAKFGFREQDTEKAVWNLSGGERARLYLSKIILNNPNALILDEPTNHLDIPTIKALENALSNYDGTIVFVSHDIAFIKKLANRIFLLKNGTLTEKFSDLESILKNDFFNQMENKKNAKSKPKPKRKKKTNPILIEKKLAQIEEISQKIEDSKIILKNLHKKFEDADFMKNAQNVKNLNGDIKNLEDEIAHLEKKQDALETEYLLMIEGEE